MPKKSKAKAKKVKYRKICPKCGGTNVRPDLSKDMIAWGGSTQWECVDCNFSAQIFPEAPEEQIEKLAGK